MKVLIVGADSSIAKETADTLADEGCTVTSTTRRLQSCGGGRIFLDLMDEASTWDIPDVDSCLIAAAQAKLEVCEADPQATNRVNVLAVRDLAARLEGAETFFLLLSTNRVFDGSIAHSSPNDATCPTSIYGKQKAEAEAIITKSGCPSAILRLSKVAGSSLPLIEAWKQDLLAGREIYPFMDMTMAPVPMQTVTQCIKEILMQKTEGIFQLSGDQDLPFSDIAHRLAKYMGVDTGLVKPIKAKESGIGPHINPANTTLDSTRTLERFFIKMPSSLETIKRLIK